MSGAKKSRGTARTNVPNKTSIYARDELLRKGINPIDMLLEVYMEAMKSYREGHGDTEKGHAGTAYLSTAGNAAARLMEYYSPKLTAIAMKVDHGDTKAPMTALDAVQIINSDPFANHAKVVAEKVTLEAKDSATPVLAKGVIGE